jgi:hypothetical protein
MSLQPATGRPRELAAMHERAQRARRRRDLRTAERGPTRISLWLPTTALFLLLAPFALLTLPILYLAPREVLPKPAATLVGIGAVLLSLGGTDIDVDRRDARVRLHLF